MVSLTKLSMMPEGVHRGTATNSIQECMKINLEMIRQANLTYFWVRKTMAGSRMFYDAKIAHLQSPE